MTNEFHRRYRNNSRDLPAQDLEEVVKRYVQDLKRGGFRDTWIKNALQAASVGYGRLIKAETEGGRKINRPASYGQKKRIVKRLTGKSTWFKAKPNPDSQLQAPSNSRKKSRKVMRGVPETVMFVPHTPNGDLKKALQKIDAKVNGQCKFSAVKMVETLGPNLNNSLSNNSPWNNTARERTAPPAWTRRAAARRGTAHTASHARPVV